MDFSSIITRRSTLFLCAVLLVAGCIKENMGGEEMASQHAKILTRRAVGAGRWFPAGSAELKKMVDGCIDGAAEWKESGLIAAGLAPHAGFIYSGKVAGHTYRAIRDQAKAGHSPDTVVVLGLSHRMGFKGVALMDGDAISTPLGETELDKDAAEILTKHSSLIKFDYAPHNGEWSAENQAPFVQAALPNAKLVIGIIGDHDEKTANAMVEALEKLAEQKKIMVVASSDMLHDPNYDLVTDTDADSLKLVAAMRDDEILSSWSYDRQTFCGVMPLVVAMRFAKTQGCKEADVLYYRNSGDDFPESRGEWVVGYGAAVFAVRE